MLELMNRKTLLSSFFAGGSFQVDFNKSKAYYDAVAIKGLCAVLRESTFFG